MVCTDLLFAILTTLTKNLSFPNILYNTHRYLIHPSDLIKSSRMGVNNLILNFSKIIYHLLLMVCCHFRLRWLARKIKMFSKRFLTWSLNIFNLSLPAADTLNWNLIEWVILLLMASRKIGLKKDSRTAR